jgi:hypothetical protein
LSSSEICARYDVVIIVLIIIVVWNVKTCQLKMLALHFMLVIIV